MRGGTNPQGAHTTTVSRRKIKTYRRTVFTGIGPGPGPARKKGELIWEGHKIMLFPDYSKATQTRQDKFKDCKKKLHKLGINFRLNFPAKLIINAEEGPKTLRSFLTLV